MARKARKIKDKWKEKKWVHVIAPDSFNNVTLGYVPITDDENAKVEFWKSHYGIY